MKVFPWKVLGCLVLATSLAAAVEAKLRAIDNFAIDLKPWKYHLNQNGPLSFDKNTKFYSSGIMSLPSDHINVEQTDVLVGASQEVTTENAGIASGAGTAITDKVWSALPTSYDPVGLSLQKKEDTFFTPESMLIPYCKGINILNTIEEAGCTGNEPCDALQGKEEEFCENNFVYVISDYFH